MIGKYMAEENWLVHILGIDKYREIWERTVVTGKTDRGDDVSH